MTITEPIVIDIISDDETGKLNITNLTDASGQPLNDGNVHVVVYDENGTVVDNSTVPIINGSAAYDPKLPEGNYTVETTIDGGNYHNQTTVTNITVTKPIEANVTSDNTTGKFNITNLTDASGQPLNNGTATIVVYDENGTVVDNVTVPIVNGTIQYVPKLPAGNYTVNTTINGGNYNNLTIESNITITEADLGDIVLDNTTGRLNITNLTDASGQPLNNGTANIVVYDENGTVVDNVTVPIVNGTVQYEPKLPIGNYTINTTINGGNYNNYTFTNDVTITDPVVVDAVAGEDIDGNPLIELNNLTDVSGNVLNSGNATIVVYDENGTVIRNVTLDVVDGSVKYAPILLKGNYTVSVDIEGSNYNAPCEFNMTVGDNAPANIKAENMTIFLSKGDKFYAYVYDAAGNLRPLTTVKVEMGNNIYFLTTDSNGKVELPVTLKEGVYNVTVTVNDTNITAVSTITVYDANYTITASNVSAYYNQGNNLVVVLYKDGKIFANAKVSITLNGNVYTVKTDANGKAQLAVSTFKPGNYVANITYDYASINASVKITKAAVKFTSVTKSVKRGKYFSLKVLNGKNKPAKSVKVTIKFGSKTYTVKTNSQGVAKLKVSLAAKKYSVTVKAYANTYYKALTKKYTVTVKK